MNITKRCFVRLISFSAAIILALSAAVLMTKNSESALRMKLEYNMMKNVEELAAELDDLRTTITKGMYASSPEMTKTLSVKLASDADNAKTLMSALPVYELHLENTYKFLSQVGNYCNSLAKKAADGEKLSDEDRKNLEKLRDYAATLSEHLWSAEQKIRDGKITFDSASKSAYSVGGSDEPDTFSDCFTDLEDNYESYPKLIYDGPFSDHIMEKEPEMLKNQRSVSADEALKTAISASGRDSLVHSDSTDEKGKMPSYIFEGDNVTVSVTKSGGFLCYMLGQREVKKAEVSAHSCVSAAKDFLEKQGYYGLIDTYYEINGNKCTINFAAKNSDVIFYTDLIKVTVAMDNREILSCDMRGYLTNHKSREPEIAAITAAEAAKSVSSLLKVDKTTLCVIPSDGKNEALCYEVNCTDKSGQKVLVYINAKTGAEEEILLLRISENGTLTV